MSLLKKVIRHCPCCGGEARTAEHCCCKAVFVVCKSCSLSTSNIYYGGDGYPSFATKDEAESVAIARWNRRTKIQYG